MGSSMNQAFCPALVLAFGSPSLFPEQLDHVRNWNRLEVWIVMLSPGEGREELGWFTYVALQKKAPGSMPGLQRQYSRAR